MGFKFAAAVLNANDGALAPAAAPSSCALENKDAFRQGSCWPCMHLVLMTRQGDSMRQHGTSAAAPSGMFTIDLALEVGNTCRPMMCEKSGLVGVSGVHVLEVSCSVQVCYLTARHRYELSDPKPTPTT